MDAVVLDALGGAEALRTRRVPVPDVGPTDVLIRIRSAGVGSWDALEREGGYADAFGIAPTFPYVLGWDGAGEVAAVGDGVTRFRIGDRVYAATMPLPRGGCYAEYAVVDADFVAHVPVKVPTDQAGAMPWDALTALTGLELLELQPSRP